MKNKPGLILALPRSGTNWTVDVLKAEETRILQEPLWLHNGGQYEQNPLHPMRSSTAQDISTEFGHKALADDQYGQLLVKNFLAWAAEQDGKNHMFKETDGFFHLEWLLETMPDLKILLIQRDIRGIISSFKKGDLFQRWGYRQRLRELLRTVQSSNQLDTLYGEVISRKNVGAPPWIALTYYLGVSMLEIRRQIKARIGSVFQVSYEDMLEKPEETFSEAAEMMEIRNIDAIIERVRHTIMETRSESTHSTRKRKTGDNFETYLSVRESEDIYSIWQSLGLEIDHFPTHHFAGKDKDWDTPRGHDYTPCNNQDRTGIFKDYYCNRVTIPGTENVWTINTLVTNTQYANFLNWLQLNGIPICINGRNIFYNDRPQSKIHLVDGTSVVNAGFENHPATHMNLLGAASFAKWLGGRLPTPEEIEKVCFTNGDGELRIDKTRFNFGHHYPETTPVKHFPPNALGVYDAVGNVGIWTAEQFSNEGRKGPLEYTRMCGGWSKDIEELQRDNTRKGRPWWMAASTLGLRPIFVNDHLPELSIVLDQITGLLEKLESRDLTTDQKNKIVHQFVTQ